MNFRTLVDISSQPGLLTYRRPVVTLGSCFADNVAARLGADLFDVTANPLGTLYNPLTIDQLLRRALDGDAYSDADVVWDPAQGLWHGWQWHGCMSATDKDEAIKKANERLKRLLQTLAEASLLVLTFGTAYVWSHRTGRVVANCHKLPSAEFSSRMLSVDEACNALTPTLQRLLETNPDLHILLTVSPVRHIGRGLHDNNLSKGTLHLATSRLCELNERVSYFPSYELLVDDLRDYRFYARDMCHPSDVAVDYIYGRFTDAYIAPEEAPMMQSVRKFVSLCQHRPLSPNPDALEAHHRRVKASADSLAAKYPLLKDRIFSLITS